MKKELHGPNKKLFKIETFVCDFEPYVNDGDCVEVLRVICKAFLARGWLTAAEVCAMKEYLEAATGDGVEYTDDGVFALEVSGDAAL